MRTDLHYVDQFVARRQAEPLQLIPVAQIDGPYPTTGNMERLTRSIIRHGILQPLIVRRHDGRYELIAGSRRLAAAMAAGLQDVPCIVRTGDDDLCRELAEAANLGHDQPASTALVEAAPSAHPAEAPPVSAPLHAADTAPLARAAFPELMEHLGAISACLHLFVERERPVRERVAFGLIRAEVHRAAWLAQALATLTGPPSHARSTVDLRALVRRAAAAMEPERQLCGVEVDIRLAATASVQGDEAQLGVAVAGLVYAMQAVVEQAGGRRVRLAVEPAPSDGARVLVAPDACVVPDAVAEAFLDATWSERPGGATATIAVAAAARVTALHGGTLTMQGPAVVLTLLS
jgi:ParB-like chromosome segregation protein Spo0J